MIIFVIAIGIVIPIGCSDQPKVVEPESQRKLLLGTTIGVSIYDEVPDGIFEEIFDRVEEIQWRMTVDEDDSEASAINQAAGVSPVAVSPDTFAVVDAAVSASQHSAGAFDVAIGPLVKLWDIGSETTSRPPPDEAIQELLPLVDYTAVQLDYLEGTVYLEQPGMAIDLGGIAKGFAADEAARILREAGVQHALMDFGGNILTIGHKPDGSPWRIGVQRPDDARGRYIGILKTTDRAVVTSGPYERFFIGPDGTRYHHIIDPDTGYPARPDVESVTVISKDSMLADALSTSLYVMGLERGMQLVESSYGVESIMLTEDGVVHLSSGIGDAFELTSDDYRLAGAPIVDSR